MVALASAPKRDFLRAFNYVHIPGDETFGSESVARLVLAVKKRASEEQRTAASETISGNVTSYDLDDLDLTAHERKRIRDLVRKVILELLGLTECQGYYVVAPKILVSLPDFGSQAIHFDTGDAWLSRSGAGVGRWTFVLYLSAGAQTTAVPRYTKYQLTERLREKIIDRTITDSNGCEITQQERVQLPPFDAERSHPESKDSEKEMRAVSYLLDSEWYHSIKTNVGDMMIIHESVLHHSMSEVKQDSSSGVLLRLLAVEREEPGCVSDLPVAFHRQSLC